jgi:hypothetical protein
MQIHDEPTLGGQWSCDVSRSTSWKAVPKAATPMTMSSSAATAAMIPTWISETSHRDFSESAGRTGFRQASRHTGSTSGFSMGNSELPPVPIEQ